MNVDYMQVWYHRTRRLIRNQPAAQYLIDVSVRSGVESLREIVIVVAHEEFYRIVGEKCAQFVRELRSQHLGVVEKG